MVVHWWHSHWLYSIYFVYRKCSHSPFGWIKQALRNQSYFLFIFRFHWLSVNFINFVDYEGLLYKFHTSQWLRTDSSYRSISHIHVPELYKAKKNTRIIKTTSKPIRRMNGKIWLFFQYHHWWEKNSTHKQKKKNENCIDDSIIHWMLPTIWMAISNFS